MLGAEVGAQVHNLPSPKTDEQPGGADAEPLDTVVRALVGVAQSLLSCPEVIHLADNLSRQLLNASQLSLDRLELLGGLDGGPVLGVSANVNVELDGSGGGAGSSGYNEMRLGLTRCLRKEKKTGWK